MKKITLLFSLLFVAVLSTWSQSTFTILPKFQVGDTLVYEAVTTSGKTMKECTSECKSWQPKVLFNRKRKGRRRELESRLFAERGEDGG